MQNLHTYHQLLYSYNYINEAFHAYSCIASYAVAIVCEGLACSSHTGLFPQQFPICMIQVSNWKLSFTGIKMPGTILLYVTVCWGCYCMQSIYIPSAHVLILVH